MKSHGKYFASLFIALYLLSPLAGFALANQNIFSHEKSDSCFSTGSGLADQVRDHSGFGTEDEDANDVNGSSFCHMPSISFSCPYAPLDSGLDNIERCKELPQAYASIFVPPQ